MFKVDKIFIILIDPYVGVTSPSSLDHLVSKNIFGLELNLLLPLYETPPSPLNLNGSNVIHGESVIFKQPPSQTHFISSLDDSSAIIPQTLVFILMHNIEL